jgi:hypothetical protein
MEDPSIMRRTSKRRPEPQPLRAYMRANGITVQRLATDVDVAVSSISDIANGYRQGSPRLRTALTDHLGVPEHELFRPLVCRYCGGVPAQPGAEAVSA